MALKFLNDGFFDGKVGIGTATPEAKLQVSFNGGHTSGTINIADSSFDIYNPLEANTDEKGSILTFSDNYLDDNGYQRTTRAAIKGGTDLVGNDGGGFLALYTDSGGANSATERMRIDDEGKVGIGTATPVELLYVDNPSGDARIGINAPAGSDTEIKFSNADVVQYTIGHDDSTDNLVIGGANVDAPFVSIDKGGKVGIGTTAPGYPLEVNDRIAIKGSAVPQLLFFETGSTYTDAMRLLRLGDKLSLTYGWNVNEEALTVVGGTGSDVGNVGIGTTSPSAKLVVDKGSEGLYLKVGGGASGGRALTFTSSTINGSVGALHTIAAISINGAIALTTAGSEKMRISTGGNVGIGNTSPDASLAVKGLLSLALSGTITISNSSNAVTGTNTAFLTELEVEDSIKIGAEIFTISAIGSNTSLTLDSNVSIASTNVTAFKDPTLLSVRNGDNGVQVIINKSGHVGIGSTSPTEGKLVVEAVDEVVATFGRDGTDGDVVQIYNGLSGTTKVIALAAQGNDGAIYSQFGNLILQQSAGRVGIGTTNPGRKLDVLGVIRAQGQFHSIVSSAGTNLSTASGGQLSLYNSSNTDGNFNNIGGYNSDSLVTSQICFINESQTSRTGSIAFMTHNGSSMPERMRINSAGDVGIGTDNPLVKFHVLGQDATFYSGTATQQMDIGRNAGEKIEIFIDDNTNKIRAVQDSEAGVDFSFILDRTIVGTDLDAVHNFEIQKDGTAQVLIDKDGKVGIGTTSPAATLEPVNISATSDGDGSASQTLSGQDSILLSTKPGTFKETSGAITWRNGPRRRVMITAVNESATGDGDILGLAFYTQGTDGPGDFFESMRIAHSGNVGIGTTNPGNKLQVAAGNGAVQAWFGNTSHVSAAIRIGGSNAEGGRIYIQYDGDNSYIDAYGGHGSTQRYRDLRVGARNIIFSTDTAVGERMRIDSAGNVGIGETNPSEKLEVKGGDIRIVDASAGLIFTAPNGKLWKQTISNTGVPVYTDVSP